jgi:multimeric flavodoxin WrbA
MIDRLVCADGGNPDPTATHGKDAAAAQRLERQGWSYPRHLEGRSFALVVHGDTEGAQTLRRMLADWLSSMSLRSAGHTAELDRYIGYYEPYADSHAALDRDAAVQDEVRNAARVLARAVAERRNEAVAPREAGIEDPRPK